MSENNNLDRGAVKDLVNLGRAQGQVVLDHGMNLPAMVIPNDHKLVSLELHVFNRFRERPVRMEGTVSVDDAGSFAEYYRLFSDINSRVFADQGKNTILGILDYHGAGSDGGPRWGAHRVRLALQPSTEWNVWNGADGEKMSQGDFATFLEDNSYDIVDPSAATMLEVASDLNASIDGEFGSAIRLNNGSVNFKYSETVRASVGAGQMQVPERFKIAIPLFLGGDRIAFECRLRYRLNSGKLTFWYDMNRKQAIQIEAFRFVVDKIAKELGITILNGTPAA